MTAVITMAGLGSRFQKAGYQVPKYMIEAKGRTLFEWSLDSLLDYDPHISRYVFVVRKEDDPDSFIRQKCRVCGLKNIEIVGLDCLTDGQATTCMLALPYCEEDAPILVYNIDTYVEPHGMRYSDISGDGHIPCFHAPGDHWSFVRLDDMGNAVEEREKKRISDNCTLGAYYFSSAGLYRRLYEEYYSDGGRLEKNERYIAPLYNLMIEKGMKVTISIVPAEKVHVLGTPDELQEFVRG